MGKTGFLGIFNLLRSTRAYRVLPTLMIILVSAAFAGFLNREVLLLGFVAVLVYSASGVYNSIRDKDHSLPKYSKKMVWVLLLVALFLSLMNRIVFFTALAAVFLGVLYNTYSRRVVLGDNTVLAVTHFVLPSLSASLLLGLDLKLTGLLGGVFFLIGWFITPVKNLKDADEDRKRGYVTLVTKFSKGVSITKVFISISFVLMFLSYFLFGLSNIHVPFVAALLFFLFITMRKINNKDNLLALDVLRFAFMVFMVGIILSKSFDFYLITLTLSISLVYLTYYAVPKKRKKCRLK
jgi:4-hydroxybenzoate polyprenyltransferase